MKCSLLFSSDFVLKAPYPGICVYFKHLCNVINEANNYRFKANNRSNKATFETNSVTFFLSVMFILNSC